MCSERKSWNLFSSLLSQTSMAIKDFDAAKHSCSCKYRYCSPGSFCVPVFICFNISSPSLVVFLSAHSALRGERHRGKKKKGIHSGPVCICSIYEMGTLIPGVLSAAFAHYFTLPLALLSASDTDS